MSSPMPIALPYGARDLKITEYLDASGEVLGSTSVDLPYLQTLNFSEAEEFQELRGDDKLVTTRGRGSSVNWDLEAGGMSTEVWAILTGGDVIEVGVEPLREIEIAKRATQARPWFRIDGRIVSDSGGDILVRLYRCRCNDNIQANFADGEFMTTQVSGVGYPLLDESNDLIYSIFQRETAQVLSLTPAPNPIKSPLNLSLDSATATTADVTWTPVVGADEYLVEWSDDLFATVDGDSSATNPTVANYTITPLVADTVYQVRVSTIAGTEQSVPCPVITFRTPAS